MDNSTFIWSEPSLNLLAALAPFSREMKELSGEALWRVELEKRSTWHPVVLIILLGDDDDHKGMMMSAAKDKGDDLLQQVTRALKY